MREGKKKKKNFIFIVEISISYVFICKPLMVYL